MVTICSILNMLVIECYAIVVYDIYLTEYQDFQMDLPAGCNLSTNYKGLNHCIFEYGHVNYDLEKLDEDPWMSYFLQKTWIVKWS